MRQVLIGFTLQLNNQQVFSKPTLLHFPCSAIVLIHQETNAERHWGMLPPKKHPSHIGEVCAVLPGQLSPLSIYCWARQMRKSQ